MTITITTDVSASTAENLAVVPSLEGAGKKSDLLSVPFCIFIGPQRAGTSWVYRYLLNRGDLCLPTDVKEVFYFDEYYKKGTDFYLSHFNVHKGHKKAVDVTTTSFAHPEAPQRIFDMFGANVRLVCPLRDPIMRSYSLYKHYLRYGIVKGNLKGAIKSRPDIIDTSRYSKYLEEWFDLFGQENIHISFQEHLSVDKDSYVKRICECIGIDYVAVPDEFSGKYNATARPPSYLLAAASQKLAQYLRKKGLYSVINFAKSLGVKKYIFGQANPDADPTGIPEADRELLEQYLGDEKRKLEELLGYEITYWK